MDLHQFHRVKRTKSSLLKKFSYLRQEGLEEYQETVRSVFGLKRFPRLDHQKVIQQILYKTLKERTKKETKRYYYIANARCFLDVTNQILSPEFLDRFKSYRTKGEEDILIYNYYELFHSLLFDAIYLLTCYEIRCGNREPTVKVFKNPAKHPREFHEVVKQALFGQYSFHSYYDKAHDMSVTMIRQMIELRLRRAFGVIGKYNKLTDIFEPVPMSIVFSALHNMLDEDRNSIDFSVPLEDIERVYSWANLFVHGGLTDFIWKPMRVSDYLKTFAAGQQIGNTWSVDFGICLSSETLTQVQDLIIQGMNTKYQLVSMSEPSVYLRPHE